MKAEQLFDEIGQFVKESHALLESGAIMELTGLDERVRTLCDQVLQLTQEERLMYADRLQELLEKLNGLGQALVSERDKLGEEASQLTQHKKAHVAYRTADARDNYGDKDED